MNTTLKNILLFDKVSLGILIVTLLALVMNVMSYIYMIDIEKENDVLKPQISEMQSLADEALHIKGIVKSKEIKIKQGRSAGVVSALENILKSLGLNAKVIRPLDKKKTEGFLEENAELEIEDTDLNSIVNLLYQIESSPSPIKIKSASLKTAFENPDRFILKLSVALLGKG